MAASKKELGALHAALTDVFTKVLQKYIDNLDMLDTCSTDEIKAKVDQEVADEASVLLDMFVPSPALLSAVAKFLKDNEIRFDDEDVNKLSGLERSLAEKHKARPQLVTLNGLAAVGE